MVVEELLETLVGVVDADLLKAIELNKTTVFFLSKERATKYESKMIKKSTYVEDLEAGNIEYADEVLTLGLDVERFVDTVDEPLKQATVDRLAQRTDRVDHLCLILALVYIFIADLPTKTQNKTIIS